MSEFVAELVAEADALRHLGQVAAVTTEELKVIRRKFVSTKGWELGTHRLSDVEALEHADERPLSTLLTGAFLLVLGVGIVALLVLQWNELQAGTKVPVSAIGVTLLVGFRRAFSARRHRLVFKLRDGTTVWWASRPGEHALRAPAVANVLELARARGWPHR